MVPASFNTSRMALASRTGRCSRSEAIASRLLPVMGNTREPAADTLCNRRQGDPRPTADSSAASSSSDGPFSAARNNPDLQGSAAMDGWPFGVAAAT